MTSVSEMSIDYVIGDVLTSVQLPLSFQEQLVFEEKKKKSIDLKLFKHYIYKKTCNLNVIILIV